MEENEMYIKEKEVKQILSQFQEAGVNYIYIDSLYGTLPDALPQNQPLEFLVKPEEREKIYQIFYQHDYLRPWNPWGKEAGWKFAYQLPENQYWKFPRSNRDTYLLINFKLCCKSLTPRVWIPLDQVIQSEAWESKVWNSEQNVWQLEEKIQFVLYLVKSILEEKEFSAKVKQQLKKQKDFLTDNGIYDKLEKIFFGYTKRLCHKVFAEEFDSIVEDYITFIQY